MHPLRDSRLDCLAVWGWGERRPDQRLILTDRLEKVQRDAGRQAGLLILSLGSGSSQPNVCSGELARVYEALSLWLVPRQRCFNGDVFNGSTQYGG
jgi:hypothetical protein